MAPRSASQEVVMSPISAPPALRPRSIIPTIIGLLLLIVAAGARALPPAQARPAAALATLPAAPRVSPLAYRTDLQPLRAPDGHPIVPQADVLGAKRVMVLRVYFHDYMASSRFTKAQVQGFFGQLDQLWRDTSYGKISISSQVSDLYQLPSNRSDYVDDFPDGDLSNGGKYWKVLGDAIDNAPAGLDWTNLDAIMVVMAE